jgi:hypothetical protein
VAWRGGLHDRALLYFSPNIMLLEIEQARCCGQKPRHAPFGLGLFCQHGIVAIGKYLALLVPIVVLFDQLAACLAEFQA